MEQFAMFFKNKKVTLWAEKETIVKNAIIFSSEHPIYDIEVRSNKKDAEREVYKGGKLIGTKINKQAEADIQERIRSVL